MKGQLVLRARHITRAEMDVEWSRKNTITGKCDWSDWRSEKTKKLHARFRVENARMVAKAFPVSYKATMDKERAIADKLRAQQKGN